MNTMETEEIDHIIIGRVKPYIYAFETNTIPNFLKVGDTYRAVSVRLAEWRRIYGHLQEVCKEKATVDEKTYFRDYAVHKFLEENGFRRIEEKDIAPGIYFSREFFNGAKEENVKQAIQDIKKSFEDKDNRYDFYNIEDNLPLGDFKFERDADWKPRDNQKEVIGKFKAAVESGRTNLLMFAVMRFGKSFTSLCCAKEMGAKLTVVICGKTAVHNEWKENVQRPKILKGFCFIDSESLEKNHSVISEKLKEGLSVVVFLTFQDLLGNDIKKRHEDLFKNQLDLLIIDETHFGARAEKFSRVLGNENKKITKTEQKGYDEFLDDIEETVKEFSPKVKLHLSGTPYRILLDNEFKKEDIIGIVQYSDIINAKEEWDKDNLDKDEWDNPYYGFPQMVRFAFNLNESAKQTLSELKNNGYSYDLSELFAAKSNSPSNKDHKTFKHEKEILDLLYAIDGSKEDENIFPFLNYDKIKTGKMCRHIVMVLPYRASCDAMAELLAGKKETFFNLKDYEVINIAGFNCSKSFNGNDYASQVKSKILSCESKDQKTISLTVGKMLTGSTVKEWDTMIFLRNTSSPQDYDQAIFRLQSPYIKTITSKTGRGIIKYDMKPQTLLVDFDPVRMLTLQHKKTLIANINNEERGNENLEAKLKRELEISPIIWVNANKLQQVKPKNIIDEIRSYNENKSVMDETFDIEVDSRIFEDEAIRAIIQKQPEMTAKGMKQFELLPYEDKEKETDFENPDLPPRQQEQKVKEKEDNNTDKEENLAGKLQGYYFKLLLFAFLSEKDEKTVSDIISHIKDDPAGKRIGRNLNIDVEDLALLREKINPAILSVLEDKINNINDLGKKMEPEKIGIALGKLSRLSSSEVVTPKEVADELVANLPEDISADSKILDIASKTGEFAAALLRNRRYGEGIKNNVYSIATSGVTYECTRKIYTLLGMPIEHIFSKFTSYDFIDKSRNEKILEEIKAMNFDIIVGNPPYQVVAAGDAKGSDPIWHLFIDVAYSLIKKISFIHPAKFLFNAGKTNKKWNEEMRNNEHFKIVKFYPNIADVFPPAVKLEGGVVISYLDKDKMFDKIGVYTSHPVLRSILKRVLANNFKTFSSLVYTRTLYRFTETLYKENSWAEKRPSKGHKYDMSSNAFYIFPELFFDEKPKENDYIGIYGLYDKKRTFKYIKKDYVKIPDNFEFYKVLVPAANGSSPIGKCLSTPVIGIPDYGYPNYGHTETFLSVGKFTTKEEAEACMKYIKTKFARVMLGTLKITQHNVQETWQNVPMQDFTSSSDIDWSKPIPQIDQQLYAKYNLSPEEIQFIETNVKAME